MKILIAADGSSYTKKVLAYLAAHDEWLGASHRYTVVTATPAVPSRAAAVLDRDLLRTFYSEEAEKVFKPIRTFFKRQGIDADFVAKVGPAAEVIAKEAAGGKFDLLLMGSHGHSTLGNLVLGSVSTRVIASCQLPVLIVR
jgi:nucleotide-binding universal stress UspA family protein